MTTPPQPHTPPPVQADSPPDYSDVEGYVSDDAASSTEESWDSVQAVANVVNRRPGRQTSDIPQPGMGFGSSTYGPRPEQLPTARSGSLAGATRYYREDMDPLYDWGPEGPDVTFTDGIRPKNNLAPRSLQQHRNRPSDSAMVSLTRNPDPAAQPPEARNQESGISYRRTVLGPGGYDLTVSLPTPSTAHREEVGLWKGVRPEFVARVEAFDRDNNRLDVKDNPNPHPLAKELLHRLDTPQRVHEAAERARLGQATEYDQSRHRYAEQYAQFSAKLGRPSAHGAHVQHDGNVRAYAEWWHANRQHPTIQQYARTWKAKYGRDDPPEAVAKAAWVSRRTLGPSARPPHATDSGRLRSRPQGVSPAQLFPRDRPPVSNPNPNANPNANSGNKRRRPM